MLVNGPDLKTMHSTDSFLRSNNCSSPERQTQWVNLDCKVRRTSSNNEEKVPAVVPGKATANRHLKG